MTPDAQIESIVAEHAAVSDEERGQLGDANSSSAPSVQQRRPSFAEVLKRNSFSFKGRRAAGRSVPSGGEAGVS